MIEKFSKPLMVTRSSLPPFEEFSAEMRKIWDSHWLTNQGPLHSELESGLKDYLKAQNVTLFVNGHMALDAAIRMFGMRGEVITTPFTFVSTVHAVSMNGLKPVFCDIKTSDYTIDENKIEALINENTCAILPVHVYGHPCDTKKIQSLAAKYHLKVIYDAAHAFGVEVDSEPIGNFGDVSMFSFHATKVFNAIEGGALVYGTDAYKHKLDLMKNFGIEGPEEISLISYNAKMNEFQALMGLLNLKYLDENIRKRKLVYTAYHKYLQEIPGISLVKTRKDVKSNFAYMPVLVDETKFGLTRDELYDELLGYNVFTRKYFFPLITDTEAYSGCGADIPKAEYVGKRILCLPIFGDMMPEEAVKVCEIIKEISSLRKRSFK